MTTPSNKPVSMPDQLGTSNAPNPPYSNPTEHPAGKPPVAKPPQPPYGVAPGQPHTPPRTTGGGSAGGNGLIGPPNQDPLSLLTGDQRNAYSALVSIFNSYDLGSLAPDILKYVQQGFNSDTISLLLQNTDAYKQRFAGNAIRLKNGYAVLSPADYIATEQAYRQSMRAAGLPSGFYDSTSDFTNFIGNDVSASELNSRVQLASQATLTASPQYTQALRQMGLSQGDMTAYFLDPQKALPLLQQQAATAAIGSEAIVRGLTFDQGYAQQLAQAGFSQSQAAQGYSQIAGEFGRLGQTAQQLGVNYGFNQEEQAVFQPGSGNQADLLRQRLAGFNQAQQQGFVGGAQQGLGRHGGGQLS